MAYTFTRTGSQIEEIHNTVDDLPNIVSNDNLISNASFENAGSVTNPPDATPRNYNAGDELFQGMFAVSALTGVTYIDGKANGTGQLYTDVYKSEKQKLSTSNYIASIAGSDGSPVESGASFVDNGDYWRVTFDMSNAFSVKFEQGSAATLHKVKSLFDIYGHPNMGIWNVKAFGAVGDGTTDDTNAIQKALVGCYVVFPDGDYLVRRTGNSINGQVNWCLLVDHSVDIVSHRARIVGDKASGGGKGDAVFAVSDMTGALSLESSKVTVRGFTFDGGDESVTGGVGIGVATFPYANDYSRVITRLEVFDNTFIDMRGGAARTQADASSVNSDVVIKDFKFSNNSVLRTHDHGFQSRYVQNLAVTNNTFDFCGLSRVAGTSGYGDLAIDASTDTFNCKITGNLILNATSGLKHVGNSSQGTCIISGNTIEGYNYSKGFYGIQVNVEDSIVANNVIKNLARGVETIAGCIISGNNIEGISANDDGGGDAFSLTSLTSYESEVRIQNNTVRDCDFTARCVPKNVSFQYNKLIDSPLHVFGSEPTQTPALLGNVSIRDNKITSPSGAPGGIFFNYERRSPLTIDGLSIRDVFIHGNEFGDNCEIRTQLGLGGEFGGIFDLSVIGNSGIRWISQYDGQFSNVSLLNNSSDSTPSSMFSIGVQSSTLNNLLINGNYARVSDSASPNRTIINIQGSADTLQIMNNQLIGRAGDTSIRYTNLGSDRVVIVGNLSRGATYNIDASYQNVINY